MNVCILGNGLTSLSLAKALINLDINVDIISDQKKHKSDKFRTIGLTPSNIDFFNKNIFNIDRLLWRIQKIKIYSDNYKNKELINFDNKNKHLFSIIRNEELHKLLYTSLIQSKSFKFKKKLINSEYNLIINCDPKSSISKKFFFKNMKKNYYSFAYTTIIEHEKIKTNNTAIQIFTKQGPLAFLPISNTKTSVVYSYIGKKINNIQELVNFYNKSYSIKKFNEFKVFELRSSNLRNYYHQNILAFGDLLHRLHPLAGQGFNMSVRDIRQLVKIMQFKIDHGLDLDASVCIDFEKKTKHKNFLFSNSIDFVHEYFNLEHKMSTNFLSKIVKYLGEKKLANNFFTKFADNGFV